MVSAGASGASRPATLTGPAGDSGADSRLSGTLAVAWWSAPTQPAASGHRGMGAFVYPGLDESQWIGFSSGIRGLALGVLRVSRCQLLQPFFTLGFAALLLSEAIRSRR